ncbi:MAG: hypothetical protein ACK5JS_04345 [Mangrovibacterium sp.]
MKTLEITRTTTTHEGVRSTETATYNTTIVIVQEQGQTPTLKSMRVSVQETEKGYVGDIAVEGGRKNINLTNEADLLTHYVVAEEILKELTEGEKTEDVETEEVA